MDSTYLTTRDAAKILGTDADRVRHWLDTGRLAAAGHAGHTILVDVGSVRRLARQQRTGGRPWAPHTAWTAIHLLSGTDARWLSGPHLSRLKSTLRAPGFDALRMQDLARNKASTTRYSGHRAAAAHIGGRVAPTASMAVAASTDVAERFGLVGATGSLDGYVAEGESRALASGYHLKPEPSGSITFREVGVAGVTAGMEVPVAAIALDLMDSLATRERSAGIRVLNELIEAFRAA